MPVHLIGGRFAVDQLAPDGRLIDFHRMGPLSIRGLKIDGLPPKGAAAPVISFWPQTAGPPAVPQLSVSDVSFAVPGSNAWEPVRVSSQARVNASGNSCVDAGGSVSRCRGLAGGVSSSGGLLFAELAQGSWSTLAPGHTAYCEDCAADASSGVCRGAGTDASPGNFPKGGPATRCRESAC